MGRELAAAIKSCRALCSQGRRVARDGEVEDRHDEQAPDNAGLSRRQRQLQLRIQQGRPCHRRRPRAKR